MQEKSSYKPRVCFYCGRSQELETPRVTDAEDFEVLTADDELQYNYQKIIFRMQMNLTLWEGKQ